MPSGGRLAIETANDFYAVDRLDEPEARAAITAERALLRTLGGGCQVPVGAYAKIAGKMLQLRAVVASADGAIVIRQASQGPVSQAADLGAMLGDALIKNGAREILDDAGA